MSDQKFNIIPALKDFIIPIASLSLDPANLRRHNDHGRDQVAASLQRFQQHQPIVMGKNGIILAGNGTLSSAIKLEWTHIAAVLTDMTAEQWQDYSFADNYTAGLSMWDTSARNEILSQLVAPDAHVAGVHGTGWTRGEAEAILGMFERTSSVPQQEKHADRVHFVLSGVPKGRASEVDAIIKEVLKFNGITDTATEIY